jgi:glucose-6-phosphate-specific signal transduction histidine kinase
LLALAVNRILGSEAALLVWALAYALLFSPVFSWIGWILALPAVTLALRFGWFGWLSAALIGAIAGAVAGEALQIEAAPAFGLVALLCLRALLGRRLPLQPGGS